MTIALVRHGRTSWNHARRMQGRTDIPLDDHGRAEAAAAGRALSHARWDRVVASPLGRAHETAQIIAAHLAPAHGCADAASPHRIDVDERLLERGYGEAEGMQVADVLERWPAQDYPGGESEAETIMRGTAAVRDLIADGRSTVAVAHGTLIRLTVSELTGTPCPRILNGQIVLLERDGDGFSARIVSQ